VTYEIDIRKFEQFILPISLLVPLKIIAAAVTNNKNQHHHNFKLYLQLGTVGKPINHCKLNIPSAEILDLVYVSLPLLITKL
jgi:hypothetical protein